MFKVTQSMPKLTGSKYEAFKTTMKAAKKKAVEKELDSIRRTISNPLPGEGPKTGTWGISSPRGGSSRRRRKSRKKRRKRKTKRKKSRKRKRSRRRKRRK